MNIRLKVWIEKGNKYIVGDGRIGLLCRVKETGSISSAAKMMRMSYSAAHSALKRMEKNLGFKLLKRKCGGNGGGGSRLTERAKELIKRYSSFRSRVASASQKSFEKGLRRCLEG